MEALPIFLDSLVSAWGAILISVTLILMFGEAGKGGELTHDETTIIAGALEMSEKTAVQAMTPINSVFSLDVNAKLDLETMNLIMAIGHSRIPVYSEKPNHIIGLVLVKNLLGIRPQDETPVKNCTIRKIPRVGEEMPLYDILNEFQKGHSHMAVVVKYNVEKSKFLKHDREQKVDRWKAAKMKKQSRRKDQKSRTYKYLALDIPGNTSTDSGGLESEGGLAAAVAATLLSSIQGTDELQQRSKKSERGWEHSPDNVLDIKESVDFPSFSSDEEVTGVITMEDVIEELLQEEILDETDEYIDVHARIKVNLLPPEGKDVPLHFPPKSISRSSTLPKSFEPYLDDFVPDSVR